MILSGRRGEALQAVAAQAPEHALVLTFETTDYERLPDLVEQAWNWRGRIDLLINNAGISQRSLALDTSFDVYRQLIEVDYLAPLALTQQVLPRMVEQGGGQLAIVSSVAAVPSMPWSDTLRGCVPRLSRLMGLVLALSCLARCVPRLRITLWKGLAPSGAVQTPISITVSIR